MYAERGGQMRALADIIDMAHQLEDTVKDELAYQKEKIKYEEARIAEEDDPANIAAAAALSAQAEAAPEPAPELWVQCSACDKCAPHPFITLTFTEVST